MYIGELAMYWFKKTTTHFAVTVQLDNVKASPPPPQKKKKKKKTSKNQCMIQDIPLKFWYRILVLDFSSWSRQI